MKEITQAQIDSVLRLLIDLNVPVQPYIQVRELFDKLPTKKDEGKPEDK